MKKSVLVILYYIYTNTRDIQFVCLWQLQHGLDEPHPQQHAVFDLALDAFFEFFQDLASIQW